MTCSPKPGFEGVSSGFIRPWTRYGDHSHLGWVSGHHDASPTKSGENVLAPAWAASQDPKEISTHPEVGGQPQ